MQSINNNVLKAELLTFIGENNIGIVGFRNIYIKQAGGNINTQSCDFEVSMVFSNSVIVKVKFTSWCKLLDLTFEALGGVEALGNLSQSALCSLGTVTDKAREIHKKAIKR